MHVVAVTNAPFVYQATATLAKSCTFIHPAIGLHPELVKSHGNQLQALIDGLENTIFVGEVGLDYSTNNEVERNQQRKVFENILSKCHDYTKSYTVNVLIFVHKNDVFTKDEQSY
jgi:TatD DNase family protein